MSATVKELITRYIEERAIPGSRPIGYSELYLLKLLRRFPIAEKAANSLKVSDYMEHCRLRKSKGTGPATIYQDMVYMRVVLKYASIAWDMDDVSILSWERAKPLLERQQLIGKSRPRNRRPTEDELDRLLEYFKERDRLSKIPMRIITEFSVLTARRISETCRLRWGDVDFERRTCWVRDLKSPKGKGEHAEFPLLGRAWDIVMEQPRNSKDPNERIFPYNPKSCGARYTRAKKLLGIENLRLHDNRREAISRMFEQGFNVPEVAQLSLHKAHSLLLRVYTSLKPEDLHKGPASKRSDVNVHVGDTGAHKRSF